MRGYTVIDHEWNDRVNDGMKIDFSYFPKGEIEGYPEGHMTFNWNRLVYGLVDWNGYVKGYASLQKLGASLERSASSVAHTTRGTRRCGLRNGSPWRPLGLRIGKRHVASSTPQNR